MHQFMRKLYEKIAQWRTSAFKPVVPLLSFFHITPNFLSYTSIVLMLLFIIYIKSLSPWLLLLILGSVLLDLIDGPLARIMGVASDKGKFIDMLCDNLAFTLFVLGLMYVGLISGMVGGALIYFMVLSKLLRSIYNSHHYKSDWKFKAVAGFIPNFVVALSYIVLGIFLIWGIEYLNYAYALFSAVLIIDATFFYVRIVREE